MAVTEVIETMEDLVHFLKNLSPCLSKVSKEVSAREKELTHQVHREILVRCLEQVRTLINYQYIIIMFINILNVMKYIIGKNTCTNSHLLHENIYSYYLSRR